MPIATAGPATRPTQAQRSAHTQELLLDATIDCLAELGYAGTSTTEIVRRAGVSRGAQVHHYPTKAALVAAAVRHHFARQQRAFEAAFATLDPDQRTFVAAIDLLWSIFTGPGSSASRELIVAGRTDPALQPVITEVLEGFDAAIKESFARLFPLAAADPLNFTIVSFAFSLLQGASLYHDAGMVETAESSVALLRILAESAPPAGGPNPEGAPS